MHVYRWDLDKTYLETDFDSFRGLVRSATEPASEKRAVAGAPSLMRAICSDPGNRIFFLSGSPVQMRSTLEEKLRLDGVRYEGLVLKDQLGHLRKREFRALRGQFGYKLPQLLIGRRGLGAGVGETLFGDDAEIDAIVYSVYADLLAGSLRKDSLIRVMETAGAYPEHVHAALDALAHIPRAEAVDRIFIRVERGLPLAAFEGLGGRVVPVHSWWQAAVVLAHEGHIKGEQAVAVMDEVMLEAEQDAWQLAGQAQELVWRGYVPAEALQALPLPPETGALIHKAVARVPPELVAERPRVPPGGIDYIGIIRGWPRRGRPKVR